MASQRPEVAAAVKFQIAIDGKAATLTVNGARFEYRRKDGAGVICDFSAVPAGQGAWSILVNGRSYAATPLGASEIAVNGHVFAVEVFDPRELQPSRVARGSSGSYSVTAAMPGRVIRLLVEAGQAVEAGHGLIVIEAMKMQNEMKSPRAGRVAAVSVVAGAAVSAGDVLVVIE